jgi:hypothetical protein
MSSHGPRSAAKSLTALSPLWAQGLNSLWVTQIMGLLETPPQDGACTGAVDGPSTPPAGTPWGVGRSRAWWVRQPARNP